MDVTIYIDDWLKQPSHINHTDVTGKYPHGFPLKPGHKLHNGRVYRVSRVFFDPFPSLNISKDIWSHLSDLLALHSIEGIGVVSNAELHILIRRIIRLINTRRHRITKKKQRGGVSGTIVEPGFPDCLELVLTKFCRLVRFAISRNKGIYWG